MEQILSRKAIVVMKSRVISLVKTACLSAIAFGLCQMPMSQALTTKGEQHSIALKEIIETRQIRGLSMSPNGKTIAFVIGQAFLDRNERRSALFVVQTDGGSQPVKLVEEQGISNLRWEPNGKFISYLSSRNSSRQIWHIDPEGKTPEQLTNHATGIGKFEWSPDGRLIAFVATEAAQSDERKQDEAQAIVFDRAASNGVFGWIAKTPLGKRPQPLQLWLQDASQRKAQELGGPHIKEFTISDISWSPDGRKIAVSASRPINYESDTEGSNIDIGFVSLETKTYAPLVTWGGYNIDPHWSPDSRSITFLSASDMNDIVRPKPLTLFVKRIDGGEPHNLVPLNTDTRDLARILDWSRDGKRLLLEMKLSVAMPRALCQMDSSGGSIRQLSHDEGYLSEFSLSVDQTRAACIRQSPTIPPEVAILNLDDGTTKTLTALNPEYRAIRLNEESKLHLTNKYGHDSLYYLLRPSGWVPTKRYPLVVVLYSFPGRFLSDGFGNYPIQAFTAAGFAVLCVDVARSQTGYRFGNFREASIVSAYDPLASIEKGVETLVDEGIADSKRVGIMGWSKGSFLTNFAITHSKLFAVSSSGDGSLFNASTYWQVGPEVQKMYDGVMGGGPYGDTYKNWEELSPTLNAAHVRIPVLLEATELGLLGEVEFHTAIQKQGGLSELVVYRNAVHVFDEGNPKQWFYSMQRNLDWFSFWLQGKEDPDPAKKEQYARWRELRKLQQKNEATRTASKP
jgi:dipeptidyl aminopeptidase/acylaminoacyl peptidase